MAKTAAQGDTRVFYRDIKPYDAPERLDDLRGPRSGRIELPLNVYWGSPSQSLTSRPWAVS
ncbi:MAG: hypothetical protein ACYCZY_12420 [Lacisediminihabitans sp.]